MPRLALGLACLIVAGCAAPAEIPAPLIQPKPQLVGILPAVSEQMTSAPSRETLALLNDFRKARGLGAVAPDTQMTAIAYQQAKAMADADRMDHNVIGDFGSRLKAHRVLNVHAGENIGRNLKTAAAMFEWWTNSPVHFAIMTNPKVTRLGFAVVHSATSKPYWAMALASGPVR